MEFFHSLSNINFQLSINNYITIYMQLEVYVNKNSILKDIEFL